MIEEKVFVQVKNFKEQFEKVWWSCSSQLPNTLTKSSYLHKKQEEKVLESFINLMLKKIRYFPSKESDRVNWKREIDRNIEEFIYKNSLISLKEKNIFLKNGFINSTEVFIEEAKRFKENITYTEVGQALRNLWIFNLSQLIFSKKAECTLGIFGYSMLYPYTDNFLDSNDISEEEKKKINEKFLKKIEGHKIKSSNTFEEKIFKLVDNIESQYSREEHSSVFNSLICIHKAQVNSLKQKECKLKPYEVDVLGISFEKGGTSVLSDGYLINGELDEEEAKFFFGYGVLLQLCDDLQDVSEDLKEGSATIFSVTAQNWKLDTITNRLLNFIIEVLEGIPTSYNEDIEALKEIILKNCIELILLAIAKNEKMYSKAYFKIIREYFPLRVKYMKSVSKRIQKRFSKVKGEYNGMSTKDIILYALKD